MDKFVKSLKTTKRRLGQQLKMATGKAEITSDAEFDQAYRNFSDMENNLKALSIQCTSLIHNVDTWCNTNRHLADELMRFTSKSNVEGGDMDTYKQAVADLHTALQNEYDYTRRSIICVLRAHIISRIEALLRNEFAEVEKIVKVRHNILIDYDSHRAKCSSFERKGDSSNAEKFRMKADHDSRMLQEHTSYLETRFTELIEIGSVILSSETATLVACELYLVEKQEEAMKHIASGFSTQAIGQVTESIEAIIGRIKAGDNVEQGYVAPTLELPVFPYHEPPVVTDYTFVSIHEQTVNETTKEPVRYVRALYSLDTAIDGELGFKEGDQIQVLHEDPSGWWDGELNGKVGKFPSNYTTAISHVSLNKQLRLQFICVNLPQTDTTIQACCKNTLFIPVTGVNHLRVTVCIS